MASLSIPALRCGGPGYLPQSHVLRAGPFTMLFEQGELRRIRLGDREVIRRIYLTVRGPDWSTIPAEITGLKVEREGEGFVVSYLAVYRKGEVDFTWSVVLRGNADGEIRFFAEGKANSAFVNQPRRPLRPASLARMHGHAGPGPPHGRFGTGGSVSGSHRAASAFSGLQRNSPCGGKGMAGPGAPGRRDLRDGGSEKLDGWLFQNLLPAPGEAQTAQA